jgi:hypothetical protein
MGKGMIKNFLTFCVLALSFGTYAQSISVENLTKKQIAELNQHVAEMKKDPSNVSEKVRSEVEAWTDLGQNIGRATVGAAKEVGMAANEFATTPLGVVTTSIVVYKLIGKDIVNFFVGASMIFVGTLIGLWCSRRRYVRQYEYRPVLFGLYQKKNVVLEQVDENEEPIRIFGFFCIPVSWFFGALIILVK